MRHDGWGWDEAKTRAEVEKRIAERFAEADANKDGAVTSEELKAAVDKRLADAHAKMAEMRARMFDRLDADKNGAISRAEWDAHQAQMMSMGDGHPGPDGKGPGQHRAMMMGSDGGMAAMHMMQRGWDRWGDHWFTKADANNDGRVTLAEAKARPLAHFDKADANKDGTLTPEERRSAHEKMRSEWRDKRGS